jgi:hypothetical protein
MEEGPRGSDPAWDVGFEPSRVDLYGKRVVIRKIKSILIQALGPALRVWYNTVNKGSRQLHERRYGAFLAAERDGSPAPNIMKWQEVREVYPKRYVLLQILESHVEGDRKLIDDVAVIRTIDDPREATRELVNAKPGYLVYHTARDKIEILMRKSVGFWGAM